MDHWQFGLALGAGVGAIAIVFLYLMCLNLGQRIRALEGETTDAAGGNSGDVPKPWEAELQHLRKQGGANAEHVATLETSLNAHRDRWRKADMNHENAIVSLDNDIRALNARLHALEHPNPQRLALELRYLAERLESTQTKDV